MRPQDLKKCIWIALFFFVFSATAWAKSPMVFKAGKKHAEVKNTENLTLPEPLDVENVDHIVAGLSDEQVRRLLIEELKAQAQRETQATAGQQKPEGIAGFIR